MRLTNITILLLFISFNGLGQVSHKEREKFGLFTKDHINVDLFKDSTAFYSFNIQITIDKENAYQPVVTTSDQSVSDRIIGIEEFEKYDYKGLRGKDKYVKFIVPVAIIILSSKDAPRKIEPYLSDKINKLFYFPIQEEEHRKIVYLSPITIIGDKRTYD